MARVRLCLIALFLAVPLHAQTMQLSSYYGAQGTTTATAIAADSAGDVYVVGSATAPGPCNNGTVVTGVQNVVVVMVNADKQLGWCTYIGNSTDYGYGIALDASNNVYVVGMTNSPGLGTTGAYQTSLMGTYDAFVAEIDANSQTHQPHWFTYLGTAFTSQANSVFVDSTGVYITGYTTGNGWPIAGGVSQTTGYGGGAFDIAMAKLSLDGSSLLWSGYLGGSSDDVGYRLAVSPDGLHACLDGYTKSDDYPTTPGAFRDAKYAQRAAVVTCVDPASGATLASTYFGGDTNSTQQCNTCAAGLTFDSSGNLWIVGLTQQDTARLHSFPITPNALQKHFGGGLHDAFISELTTDLSQTSLVYSTYFGGSGDDGAVAPEFDSSGNLWIHGNTFSDNLPVTDNAFQGTNGGPAQTSDAFLAEFSPVGLTCPPNPWCLAYSTYLGGSANEFGGATQSLAVAPSVIWFTGYTESSNFPLVNPFDKKQKSTESGFVGQFCPSCPIK
jgi:hypothetical protein